MLRTGQKGRNIVREARFPHTENYSIFQFYFPAACLGFRVGLKSSGNEGEKGENWASSSFFLTGKASNGRAHDDG